MSDNILTRKFYEQPSLTVARLLLGKTFKFLNFKCMIIETEAYIGQDDQACHAAHGYTNRTKVMFGPAGFSYIYLIYGLHYCFNIVTEPENIPAAILIRSVKLYNTNIIVNGPGKICKILQITKQYNNTDLTLNNNFCVCDSNIILNHICTPRIGISKAQDKLWRFVAIT